MLALEGVTARYGRITALSDVSLAVAAAEFVCLIGANGAGKTTTLKTISGLRPVTSGRITFRGHDLAGVAAHRRVELGICQAPEGRAIFPGMTVLENLEMGAYARRARAGGARSARSPSRSTPGTRSSSETCARARGPRCDAVATR